MNNKAESTTSVIMWLGILTAVLISVMWLIPKVQPYHLDLETVNYDLESMQGKINAACSSIYYKAKYNPLTEHGVLRFEGSSVCINNTISKCRLALCNTELNVNFTLDNFTYVVIERNETYDIYVE